MRYLGNKTRLLERLSGFIAANNIQGRCFCDLFAGSGSVGDFFKGRYKIIANDFLYSSYVINRAKLSFPSAPSFGGFRKKYGADIFTYLNEKTYEEKEYHFIFKEYSPEGGRGFFTRETATKIDGIRLAIEQLYKDKLLCEDEYFFMLASLLESVMGVSNTTGTYEAFLKKWDSRALKSFTLTPLTMQACASVGKNTVYNEDGNALIRRISGDILYIDPPYTVTEYSSAYHLLETIARYDYPDIRGITGRRVQNDLKSDYTKKARALAAFEDLIQHADFTDIIISYSTQAVIPIGELTAMLGRYAVGGIITEEIPYREYKNIRTSQKGDNLCELMIYFQKNTAVIKSPLNYSGSKDKLVRQITACLPPRVSTFVDCMGGAFNVGANVYASEGVVYNEYNPYVFGLIEMLLTADKARLVAKAEAIIERFGLVKSGKENYVKYREFYNEHQCPLNLFVAQMFCFQNQLRFNSSMKFNTPVGNCGYNETTKQRILNFTPKTQNLRLMCGSYKAIPWESFDCDSVFYFDPPYFITSATYNDGKRGFNGWDAEQESELLKHLSLLHDGGKKFMLSNVLEHKGKRNNLLVEWIESHDFTVVPLTGGTRSEVIVKNF